jgi:fucose permease
MKTEVTLPGSTTAASTLTRFRLYITFTFFLTVGLNSGGFGVILPAFSQTYNLSKGDTGYLFLALTVGFLLPAVTGSWVTARIGLRNFMTTGLLLFIAGSLSLWLVPPFAVALLARLVLGLSGAVLETAGNFYVAHQPRNTALLNYLHAFFGVGALVGPLVATWVLENGWGWQTLFMVWMVLGLLLSVAYRLAFSDYTENFPLASESTPTKRSRPMADALKHPLVWLATFFLFLYVGVETTVGNWSYTYLTEGHGLANSLAGGMVSLYWFGLTAGRFVLGWALERPGMEGRSRGLFLGCIVASVGGAVLVWLADGQALPAGFGLFLIGFAFGPLYPTTLAILARVVEPGILSSAIGIITGLSILGVATFPWLAGGLLEGFGMGVLFPYVIGLGVGLFAVGVALLRPTRRV